MMLYWPYFRPGLGRQYVYYTVQFIQLFLLRAYFLFYYVIITHCSCSLLHTKPFNKQVAVNSLEHCSAYAKRQGQRAIFCLRKVAKGHLACTNWRALFCPTKCLLRAWAGRGGGALLPSLPSGPASLNKPRLIKLQKLVVIVSSEMTLRDSIVIWRVRHNQLAD